MTTVNTPIDTIKDILKKNGFPQDQIDKVNSSDDVVIDRYSGHPSPTPQGALDDMNRTNDLNRDGCVVDINEGPHRTEGAQGGCSHEDARQLRNQGVKDRN